MFILKIDGKRATDELEKRGHAVTVALRTQLDQFAVRIFESMLNGAAPGSILMFHGEPQFDGMMIGGPKEYALAALREAMKIRDEGLWQHPNYLPVKVACGIAEVSWDKGAYVDRSVPTGRDIIIISRLLEAECPANSIVINETLLRAVREYDHDILYLFEIREASLRGIEGEQTYGLLPPRQRPALEVAVRAWLPTLRIWAVRIGALFGFSAWVYLVARWWWLGG